MMNSCPDCSANCSFDDALVAKSIALMTQNGKGYKCAEAKFWLECILSKMVLRMLVSVCVYLYHLYLNN